VSGTSLADLSMIELFRLEVEQQAGILTESLLMLENGASGSDPIAAVMRAAHSIKGAARLVECEEAVELAHSLEERIAQLRTQPLPWGRRIVDTLLEAVDTLEEVAREKQEDKHLPDETAKQARWVAQNLREGAADDEWSGHAVRDDELVEWDRRRGDRRRAVSVVDWEAHTSSDKTIRLPVERFDLLMSLAGEAMAGARWLRPYSESMRRLKRLQAEVLFDLESLREAMQLLRLPEALRQRLDEVYQKAVAGRDRMEEKVSALEVFDAKLEGLSNRLQAEVMATRMRPFRDGVRGLPRIVRLIARSVGKEVRLLMSGLDVRVDREILQKIEAPLSHLLNNAVDHAIETPEEREAIGKPREGTIHINVTQQRGLVQIGVGDDGRGIDRARVTSKLVQRQILDRETAAALSDRELFDFILLPGFSTRDDVSTLSGRGVGLDAVADMVRSVGGTLEIASAAGRGATFTLQFPATRAVIRALIVGIGGEPYALALGRIERILKLDVAAVSLQESLPMAAMDGQPVTLVPAAHVLELNTAWPPSDALPVVVIQDHGRYYGLVVHALLGEAELVTRALPVQLGKLRDVSAVAALDDGQPVLILDVEELLDSGKSYLSMCSGAWWQDAAAARRARPGRRVLVVDDSFIVRELERKLLTADGYDVTVAVDGWSGWQAAKAQTFDLVITDVDMPRLDGLQLLRMLKQDPALQHVPVIVVSCMDSQGYGARAVAAGAEAFVAKASFHDDTLRKEVRRVLGEPQR
jgi:two-component system sensor histidine kinase and response regulator WspE